MDALKYIVGLVIFSSIGSFLIVDTISYARVVGKTSDRFLLSDLVRLVFLAGMATVGFFLAKETFVKPNDRIIFLVIGAIASIAIYALGIKRRIRN